MKIVDIRWYPYRIPFVKSFTTAHGIITAREGAIVEITTDQGITGIGEIAPLPEFAGSSLAEICKLLPTIAAYMQGKAVLEALVGEPYVVSVPSSGPGKDLAPAAPREQVYTPNPNRSSANAVGAGALCGLEIALLDALCKANDYSISTLLAPINSVPQSCVAVNAIIGVKGTRAAVEAAREVKNIGFGCVKLKVGMGENLQEEIGRIAAVREAIGSEMHLRLDANEAWSLDEAIAVLSHCVPYAIQYVEQPLKAYDLNGMRTLRQAVPIPIAADEAVHSLESARQVMAYEAADILVIKPQLAGGLRIGKQIIAEATQRCIQCVITSTIETGIGLTAALHLAAASPSITLECGLATLSLLADDLLVDEFPLRRGFLEVPAGPGLGVELDRKAIELWTTSSPIG
jgi:o-succinylbenzoate synthase